MKLPNELTNRERELADAVLTMSRCYFLPAAARLYGLLQHPRPGVRVYACVVLTALAGGHMAAFSAPLLAKVAARFQELGRDDPDERVRQCAERSLDELLAAAAVWLAVSQPETATAPVDDGARSKRTK